MAVGGILVACGGSDSGEASDAAATADQQSQEPASTEGASEDSGAEGAPVGPELTPVSDVPVEGGIVVPDEAVVVVQPSAGDIKAFDAICPHQGCLVSSVEANEIICPCHGSLFSAQDGSVIKGPSPSGLPPVNVTVEGDSVFLG